MSTELAVQLSGNFISGEWLPSASGRTLEDRNPADSDDLVGVFQRLRKATPNLRDCYRVAAAL